jgi:hypothetical protein
MANKNFVVKKLNIMECESAGENKSRCKVSLIGENDIPIGVGNITFNLNQIVGVSNRPKKRCPKDDPFCNLEK